MTAKKLVSHTGSLKRSLAHLQECWQTQHLLQISLISQLFLNFFSAGTPENVSCLRMPFSADLFSWDVRNGVRQTPCESEVRRWRPSKCFSFSLHPPSAWLSPHCLRQTVHLRSTWDLNSAIPEPASYLGCRALGAGIRNLRQMEMVDHTEPSYSAEKR